VSDGSGAEQVPACREVRAGSLDGVLPCSTFSISSA
jgi:hypothetical protein